MRKHSVAQGTQFNSLCQLNLIQMGRRSKGDMINVYVRLIHIVVQWELTQQCKATTLQ